MSRKRRSKADRTPVTRRYVLRVVQRARDDILRAIINVQTQPFGVLPEWTPEQVTSWQRALESREPMRVVGRRA